MVTLDKFCDKKMAIVRINVNIEISLLSTVDNLLVYIFSLREKPFDTNKSKNSQISFVTNGIFILNEPLYFMLITSICFVSCFSVKFSFMYLYYWDHLLKLLLTV